MTHEAANNLAGYLTERSNEICAINECTEDEHYCESYAYINADMQLLDICMSDYFQGSSEPYAVIPLPWRGSRIDLESEVLDQVSDWVKE